MNLESEKKALIKQVEQVNDIKLLRAIKGMLDYGLNKEEGLESSIERAMKQSEEREGRPHEQVMNDLRQRYKV